LAAAQVFINASTSDVVATTSVEALAMGKWLICAQHACNDWAASFSNALVYRSPDEFVAHLARALAAEPPPLGEEELRCARGRACAPPAWGCVSMCLEGFIQRALQGCPVRVGRLCSMVAAPGACVAMKRCNAWACEARWRGTPTESSLTAQVFADGAWWQRAAV